MITRLKKQSILLVNVIAFLLTTLLIIIVTKFSEFDGINANESLQGFMLFLLFNVILHTLFYVLYHRALKVDKKNSEHERFGIVGATVIVLVAVYTFIISVKDINNFLLLFIPTNSIILTLAHYDVIFFTYASLLMIVLVLSLGYSLNKVYPLTAKIVNIAVTLWLVKIFNNGLIRISDHLISLNHTNVFIALSRVLNIVALCFNLALLCCGLLIFFKNKFPASKLWLGLVVVQVMNFALNMTLPRFTFPSDLSFNIVLQSVNLFLLYGKLLFVFLILFNYQKPVNTSPFFEHNDENMYI